MHLGNEMMKLFYFHDYRDKLLIEKLNVEKEQRTQFSRRRFFLISFSTFFQWKMNWKMNY